MTNNSHIENNSHIQQEHPDYSSRARMWRRYRDLYAGGEQFRLNAAEYLLRRQKEGLEVYQERLSRVFYENYLGSIVDWYAATLVRREPILEFTGRNERAKEFSRAASYRTAICAGLRLRSSSSSR